MAVATATSVLGPFDSLADGIAALQQYTDRGKMHAPMWKALGGGGKTRRFYVCNAHKECPVKASVKRARCTAQFFVCMDMDQEHAAEDNLRKRKNSPLTMQQEREAINAIDY